MKSLIASWARFGLVGAGATLVHAAVLAVAIELFSIWAPAANAGAFLAAFAVSFIGHRQFSFRSQTPVFASLWRFLLVALVGAAASFAIFVLLADLLHVRWQATFLISAALVSPVVYISSRRFAFAPAPVRGPAWSCLAAPLAAFVAAAALSLTLHQPLPLWDHWDLLPLYQRALQGELGFADLFAPHGGHWHATGYMVLLVLAHLTHWSHQAESLASLAIAGFGGTVLCWAMARSAGLLGVSSAAPWLLAVAGYFFFSLDQASNWLWGWQVSVFLNTTGTVLAIVLLWRAQGRLFWVGAAACAAAVAIYAFATGLALLPVGLLLLLAQPRVAVWRRATGAALWGLFCLAIALHYYLTFLSHAAPRHVAETVQEAGAGGVFALQWFEFTLICLGSAIVRFTDGVAAPLAVLGLLAAGWALRRLRQNAPQGWLEASLPLLALMVYAAGSAALIGLGRLSFGLGQAQVSRYISFSNLYWIGVIGLILLALSLHRSGPLAAQKPNPTGGRQSSGAGPHMWAKGAVVLVGLLCLLKLGNMGQVVVGKDVLGDHRRSVQIAEAIRRDPEAVDAELGIELYGQPRDLSEEVRFLEERNLSLFREAPP